MVDVSISMEELNLDPIQKLEEQAKEAMRCTISDWGTRSKTKVNRAVRRHYKVKSGRISQDCRGFKKTGEFEGHLEYTGGVISTSNFSVSPKGDAGRNYQPIVVPGPGKTQPFAKTGGGKAGAGSFVQVREPNPYGITIRVKGGGQISAGSRGFIMGGAPWVRHSDGSIDKLHGPSVPTMIDNAGKSEIEQECSELAAQRLEYHMNRLVGK